ncbi:MAG: glycosyltransferase family 4 protein [Methanothrix sp.]|jgi:glycosyltransferase involved in cell wall biosynthesis|nr:glycosyltransferase family 4 protein [Methanothrix sp.]
MGNKREILIISPALLEAGTTRGGGIEKIDYRVAQELSKQFRVTIFGAYYKVYEEKKYISDNFFVENVFFPAMNTYPPTSITQHFINYFLLTPIYSLFLFIKSIRFMKGRKQLIVIVHGGLQGLVAAIAAKITKKKIIYSEGNLAPWIDLYARSLKLRAPQKIVHKLDLNIDKLIGSLSDYIRVQSLLIEKSMVCHGIDSKKIRVIPGGVDIDNFKPITPITGISSILKVGFIGRLTDEKGAQLLLEIVKKALNELLNVRFIILGDGPYSHEFFHLSNIEHQGFVSKTDFIMWLSKLHIVLFFQKDLGLAELEAMASGKAIVALNMGEVPQTIKHLENGMLCTPDAQSYINTIRILGDDPLLLENLSKGARKTAVKSFSWDVICYDWLSLCMECLKEERTL